MDPIVLRAARVAKPVGLVLMFAMTGCSSPQLYAAGQTWQRQECVKIQMPSKEVVVWPARHAALATTSARASKQAAAGRLPSRQATGPTFGERLARVSKSAWPNPSLKSGTKGWPRYGGIAIMAWRRSPLAPAQRKRSRSAQTSGMRLTRIGIAVFLLAVGAGPLYTVQGYSAVGNLISELAAQNTPRNYLMSAAFIALGASIVADGARSFHRALAPFMVFGLFMAGVGLLGHKPIDPAVAYVPWIHAAHGALATAAGISITVAFAWQAYRQHDSAMRVLAGLLAILSFALPMAMLSFPGVQGVIQRFMYGLVFAWLWACYPQRTHA